MNQVQQTIKNGENHYLIESDKGLTVAELLWMIQTWVINHPEAMNKPVSVCLEEVEPHHSRIVSASNEGDHAILWLSMDRAISSKTATGLKAHLKSPKPTCVSFESWTQLFDDTAKEEGWSLFDADGTIEIEGIDDPEDGSPGVEDMKALDLVMESAAAGSVMALLALFLDGKRTYTSNSFRSKPMQYTIPKYIVEKL